MAAVPKYWVTGGTTNWTSTTNWSLTSGGASGAAAPTNATDVIFDGNSGTGTVTLNTSPNMHSWDSSAAGALNFTTGAGSGRVVTVGGQGTNNGASVFKMASGQVFFDNGATLQFDNRFGGLTSTMNGGVIASTGSPIVSFGPISTMTTAWTMADNFTVYGPIVLSGGSGSSIVTSTFTLGNNSSVTFGSANVTLNWTGGSITCNSWTYSNTATLTGNGSSTLTIITNSTFGGATYPGTVVANGSPTIDGGNTFTNFTYTGVGTVSAKLVVTGNNTVTGTGTFTGNSLTLRGIVRSDVAGTQRTWTVATLSITNVDFLDIIGAGAGSWSGTNVGNLGNNTGITFRTPANFYAVMGGSNGNWSSNIWATSSGGSTSSSNYPIAQDTAILDNNTFSADNVTLSIDQASISIIDTSALNNHTFNLSSTNAGTIYYGNVTLCSSCTWKFNTAGGFISGKRGTQAFTTNSAIFSFVAVNQVNIANVTGTFQPQDDFVWNTGTTTSGIILQSGTFNPLGNVTTPYLVDNATASSQIFTGTSGKTLTLTKYDASNNSLDFTNVTPTMNSMAITVTDVSATTHTFKGGGKTYTSTVTVTTGGAGVVTFNGANTFGGLSVTGGSTKSIRFTNGQTTTLTSATFFQGAASNLITIDSASAGSAFTLSCASTISTDYISLKDCTGAGAGLQFYAGANSTDVSGNTNWGFSSATIIGMGASGAANSGYKTATASYTFSANFYGPNRTAVIGISMLSVGVTVTALTINSVAATFIRADTSVSTLIRTEIWYLTAPTVGSQTVSVTLSAAADSATGVVCLSETLQSASVIDAQNGAVAINVGAADATVNVTTVNNGSWVIDTVATNDTAITVGAGQTSRWNVTGTAGSGAGSTEPKATAGSVTMSWSSVGAGASWVIGAVALRPFTAAAINSGFFMFAA